MPNNTTGKQKPSDATRGEDATIDGTRAASGLSHEQEAMRTDPALGARFAHYASEVQFSASQSSTPPSSTNSAPHDTSPASKTPSVSWLARLMPGGIFARSLIIVILPLLAAQVAISLLFIERHADRVTRSLARTYVAEISILVEEWVSENPALSGEAVSGNAAAAPASAAPNAAPAAASAAPSNPTAAEQAVTVSNRVASWGERLGFTISVLPASAPLVIADTSPFYSVTRQSVGEYLAANIEYPTGFTIYPQRLRIETRVRVGEHVIAFFSHRDQAFAGNYHIFLLWMTFAILLVQLLTAYILYRQIRPIRKLASAASSWGRGDTGVELQVEGAREVRQAAAAFIEMRARLNRYVKQRTTLLAGVSHDLRTMLTRIKLGISELSPTEEVREIEADVDQMNLVVQDYLDFTRGISDEERTKINVEDFVHTLSDRFSPEHVTISVACSGPRYITTREVTLSRCLSNLLDNAVRHANRRVRITVEALAQTASGYEATTKGTLIIRVEDDGPGIPANDYERVFEPFVRLDEARNLDASGSGLGLAIARDCSRALGGDVRLSTSTLGGLSASLFLPLF